MKDVSIYIYTQFHGSLSKGSGTYHIIWETMINRNGREEPFTLKKSATFENITHNRLDLLALKEAFDHMKECCRIVIYIDSQYITSAISNGWLDSWVADNFKKKGKEIKHADLWKKIAHGMAQHEVTLKAGKTEWKALKAMKERN